MGEHWLAIFGAKSCGKTEISPSAFLHCWVWTNEMTTAARVTQWRTAYSATSSVARPQGLGSDLFPELHFSLWLGLSPLLPHLSVSLNPSSLFCSYPETSFIELPFFCMLLTVWGSSVRVRPSATELISPILLNRCWHIVFVCILFIVASPWGLKTLCGRSHSFRYTSFTSAFWSSLVHRGNSLVGTMIG